MKNSKHDKVLANKEKEKKKHLDRLATNLLKKDEQNQKMKEYTMKKNPLDFFK
jgi:hypothetical protein